MKFNLISEKEITDFEKELGVELVINERPFHLGSPSGLSRYYARFENSEVMQGSCLIGKYGNGNTIDEALKDYCKEVSNSLVAFNAFSQKRIEVRFPKLIHTKLLNK